MKGTIGFEHLRINCIIGIQEFERLQKQDIFIDLKVQLDLSKCIHTNNLKHSVDYVKLSDLCIYIAQQKKHELLETLAHEILEQIFTQFRVDSAWIKIKKPQAISNASFATIEMERIKS
jgi:FolB domain-containing protein